MHACLQLWDLVSTAGITTERDEFEHIFDVAEQEYGGNNVSLQAYRQVRFAIKHS